MRAHTRTGARRAMYAAAAQICEVGGLSALFFNYFSTLALRYAVMTVIPQIKVCGFNSPPPRLPHTHTHTLIADGPQPRTAVR